MTRKIDDTTYLKYLLQSRNVDGLKTICREYNIKGYSKYKKADLIDFILDSLAEEEISDILNQKEVEILSEAINLAIDKINGDDRESITNIKVVNPDEHEIEITFKGFSWEIVSFLSITPDNIDKPERDCDCRVGSSNGFCNHFWVGFIYSLKQEWFDLKDWTLTKLPEDFEEKIKSIKISTSGSPGGEKSVSLVNESSKTSELTGFVNKSITVYEGEVEKLTEKQSEFQDNITTYYIVQLKKVRIGPRVQKKSDFREDDIIDVELLNLRISEKLKSDTNVKIGDRVSGNGKLQKDNFLKMFIVKNIRKITII